VSITIEKFRQAPEWRQHHLENGLLGLLTFDERTGASVLELVTEEVWISPDELEVGDKVHQTSDDEERWAVVIDFAPAFNPAFRPVVLDTDRHSAIDLDRESVVRVRRLVRTEGAGR